MKSKTFIMIVVFASITAGFLIMFYYVGNEDSIVSEAEYEISFVSTWSSDTHPYNFPNNPHFSGLIGVTHDNNVSFWEEGKLASPGIQNMAETGSKDPLNYEINDAIDRGYAFTKLSGEGISKSPGSVSLTFRTTEKYPLVTLVSMVAPSPDWFVGISGLNLFENGNWIEEKTVLLYPYDAGTDSGVTFTSDNVATIPPEPIHTLNENTLPGSSIAYGKFVFKKVN